MNKTNLGQRLSAQMQFKSLLLLTLLASTASAQQPLMPPLPLDLASPAALDSVNDEQSGSSRSTWTLRQHATWLLGLKPRQVMQSAPTLTLPEASAFELPPTLAALPQLPDLSHSAVMLVQHTEPVASSEPPSLIAAPAEAAVVMAAGESNADVPPVAQAIQSTPHGLDLRPVLSGPVPALPLEAMASESLLQVDVSGIDPAKLGASTAPPESLIDSFDFRPPTGFSMSDNEPASLVASPAHAKPVSIHEGFAPRNSSANQSAELTPASGPVHNRLSDDDVAEETEAERTEKVFQKIANKKSTGRSVEKSFSDRDLLMASLPVEVSSDSDKSSRGRPEVVTPPSRLSKQAPIALPLSAATPIASTGVESLIGDRRQVSESKPSEETKPQLAAETPTDANQVALDKTEAVSAGKPAESLIDGMVPPTLLSSQVTKAPQPLLDAKPSPSTAEKLVKKQPSKAAEKLTLSDTNPLALERTVVRAANVAIPDTVDRESSVVQSSHEMDDGRHQLAEYAKMAAKMQQAIKQKFPNCRVKITCNEDGLLAEGHVANNAEASKVLSYVRKTSLCPVADRITTSQ